MAGSGSDVDEQGWFWVPGHDGEGERVPGRLIVTGSAARLEVLGDMPGQATGDDSGAFSYEILHGVLRSGHYFTLCGVTGRRSSQFRIPTVVVGDGGSPFGQHVDLRVSFAIPDVLLDEPPLLTGLRFELAGLDPVLGRRRKVFSGRQIDNLGLVPVFFPNIPPFSVRLDTWELTVASRISGLDEYPVYEIRSDDPQPLDIYLTEVVDPLLWLARFCTQRWESPANIRVQLDGDDPEEPEHWRWKPIVFPAITRAADSPERRHGPLFAAATFGPKKPGPKTITLEDFDDGLDPARSMVVGAWFDWFRSDPVNREIVRTCLQPAIAPGPVYGEDRFRSYAGALELMAEERIGKGESADDRKRREKLRDSLTEPDAELVESLGGDAAAVEWLKTMVDSPKEKGFVRLLTELIEKYEPAVAPVLRKDEGDEEGITPKKAAQTIVSRRAKVAHKTGTVTSSHDQFAWEVARAHGVLVGLILAEVLDEAHWVAVGRVAYFCTRD